MYSWKVQLIGILAFGVERSTSSSYWTLNQPMLYYTDHLHVTISNPLLFLWWIFQLYRLYWYDNDITLRDWVINKKDKDFSVDVIKLNVLFTHPYLACQSVCLFVTIFLHILLTLNYHYPPLYAGIFILLKLLKSKHWRRDQLGPV